MLLGLLFAVIAVASATRVGVRGRSVAFVGRPLTPASRTRRGIRRARHSRRRARLSRNGALRLTRRSVEGRPRKGESDRSIRVFPWLYEAFNRRDIDGVLAMMSDEVDWPNAWKGGRLVGREAVRDYWTAQWAEIDPHVEPVWITERAAGHVAVAVRQRVRSIDGHLLSEGEVIHLYHRGGRFDQPHGRRGARALTTVASPRR